MSRDDEMHPPRAQPMVPPEVTAGMSSAHLLPLVYEELRRLARREMGTERTEHTLQATALVHEAYVRLAGVADLKWASPGQFFHAAAEAMRRILIEHALARNGPKRGGKRNRVPLDLLDLAAEANSEDILALEEAFSRLEGMEPSAAAVVRLRFYAGLNVEETAAVLGISERTVKREWAFARAWLYRTLNGEEDRKQ
jgi:RNA polymerase sigma factor (TIGR02999 family)